MKSLALVSMRKSDRQVCLAVLAAALVGCVLPQAASADGSFTLSRTNPPYPVCPEATAGEPECAAIHVPAVPSTSADAIGPAFEGSGEGGGFSPADLRSAYKLPATGGSGQTVAIVDAYNDPNAESDLQKYRAKYKVYYKGTETACTEANKCFEKVNQEGKAENYPANSAEWSEEISLDVDMVSATCPECKLLLVEAKTNTENNLYYAAEEAAKLGATEINNSWYAPEFAGEESYDK